jgi:hypothetical protein
VFVCSTLSTPGGRVDIGQTPAGAWLKCDSFTGHNGTFFFDKFPSAAAAAAAFGELTAEETVGDVGGGVLRQLERETPCCFDGSSTSWSWLRDCWLARGSTFDDTHFILTPRGTRVAEAIAASELAEELFGLCSR